MEAAGGVNDGASAGYAQHMDADQAEYAAAYWRLDAEAREVMLALSPERAGESVPLSEMDELCRRMQRPLRDEGERLRLMTALDSTNQMQILRHDLCLWLLGDMLAERALASERLGAAPDLTGATQAPAQPCWEEVVALSPSMGVGIPPTAATYYLNTLTGESSWELPRFIQSLRTYCSAQATKRTLRLALPADGTPVFLLTPPADGDAYKYKEFSDLEELRELFDKCDDNTSGTLDAGEFQDLCVAVSQPLNGSDGVAALMLEVDPVDGREGVAWSALRRYWLSNSPFQRRSQIDPPGGELEAWEQIESLHQSDSPVVYRHVTTLRERWTHPSFEQRAVNMLSTLFPSSKVDWEKKIDLFLDVQWQMQQHQDERSHHVAVGETPLSSSEGRLGRYWDLRTCWRVLAQLHHPMTRRAHVESALHHLRDQFGPSTSKDTQAFALDEATVRCWLQFCVKLVEHRGWEQLVDPESGQVYYYHEVNGVTQWDPPNLSSQMADMLGLGLSSTLGGHDVKEKKLTPTERIARLFRLYDTDESGAITLDEFRPFYRALVGRGRGYTAHDDSVSETELQSLFRMLDTSGDGEVTLEEFQLWWLTKLELEEDETETAKQEKKRAQQRELCRMYLENAGAIIVLDNDQTVDASNADKTAELSTAQTDPRIGFESNLLPRLVAMLGPFELKGLAYRSALSELVTDFSQHVELAAFLEWYERFELVEMERQALEDAKALAQAELIAQQQREVVAAKEKRRKMKQRRQLATQAKPMSAEDAMAARELKITALFKAFDVNGSGFLDERELHQLAKALGHDMNSHQLREMMRIIDISGDGQVSLSEFIRFWNTFQPAHASVEKKQATTKAPSRIAANSGSQAIRQTSQHHNMPATLADMNASLEVALEAAKDRVFKVSLGDFADIVSEWKTDFLTRGKNKVDALTHLVHEHEEKRRLEELRLQRWAFQPTRTRKYGALRLDVTWIEPEVVECVSDIIRAIGDQTRPHLAPDAAQTIQALARGYVTRVWMFAAIQRRFAVYIDPITRFYYYIDTQTYRMHLERPLYRTHMSSVKPHDLEECKSKLALHQFRKKMADMKRKTAFYDRNFRAGVASLPSQVSPILPSTQKPRLPEYRPLFAPSVMFLFNVAECVHKRLLSNVWIALREGDSVLVELVAQRHPRQLRQRSSDSARNLPLHYMVRRGDSFPLRTLRAVVDGYHEALAHADAFGMTPLHIALREWRCYGRGVIKVLDLLVPPAETTFFQPGMPASKHQPRSIWECTTVCGETPLHVAVRHRASISVLRWLLVRCQRTDRSLEIVSARNKRGHSAFHLSIEQFRDSRDRAYAKAMIQLFWKHTDPQALCAQATRRGDLPLHLALDVIESQKQLKTTAGGNQQHQQSLLDEKKARHFSESIDDGASAHWLIRELTRHYPAALATRKPSNGLLPIHLAIKYGLPTALLCEILDGTTDRFRGSPFLKDPSSTSPPQLSDLDNQEREPLLEATTIRTTSTTLVHYALMHQPCAVAFAMRLLDLMPSACSVQTVPGRDLPLHLAVGMRRTPLLEAESRDECNDDEEHARLVRRLCELHPTGCETYNAARELPLHAAITRGNSARAVHTILEFSSSALGDERERRGLRALVMASSARVPDYRVLLALLSVTPDRPVVTATAPPSHCKSLRGAKNTPVTPLYALSLRECSPEIIAHGIPSTFVEKYERIEDEDAYFLEMAKSKLRHRHQCPNDKWTFEKILTLMERNPLDEAVMQRALYAINAKLLAIRNAPTDTSLDPQASPNKTRRPEEGDAKQPDRDLVILETLTLNADLMLVRTVHQTMYEFPQNPRLQILGKGVLDKLLPTAYAKAAYKAKIDPYFNM